MQSSMFSGLFGALTNEARMNTIANNLANVNTTGFKQEVLAFRDTMILFAHDQIYEPLATVRSEKLFPEPHLAARPRIAVSEIDFSQGGMQTTGNPLDVAIGGEGFFRVQSPQGNMLSRNGAFTLDATGQLTTKQGWPVLDDGGSPIVIPPGTTSTHIAPDGRVFADEAEVGTLALVTTEDLQQLERVGGNMYRFREGTEAAEVSAYEAGTRLHQGFLESSSVNVVTEMVNMIEANRQFEAYTKLIQTASTLDTEAYNKVGRAR